MGGKVTCTTCGKVWENRLDYLSDTDKCGKNTCPLAASEESAKAKAKRDLENLFKKAQMNMTYTHDISTSSVKSKIDPSKEDHQYYDVPKAIITEMKRVKTVS